jgi:hypothetical protein
MMMFIVVALHTADEELDCQGFLPRSFLWEEAGHGSTNEAVLSGSLGWVHT